MTDASLLAVFAHPDDESLACGGLLARCAELGVRTSLLCLTHGEHGPGGTGDHGKSPSALQLRDARAGELREAAGVLGVRDVVLLDHEDGMLPWIDAGLLEADVLDAVRRFGPDVVVTFDADGLYWHPDHVAVHERTTSAVAGLGAVGPALRYVGMPPGRVRALVDAASRDRGCAGEALRPFLGVDDADAFGWMAPPPTLVFEAGRHAETKVSALLRHRSQVEGTALDCVDTRDAARLLATEHYRPADVGAPGEAFLDGLCTAVTAPSA